MLKDYRLMVDLAHHYASSTRTSVCVLGGSGDIVYQEPEGWFSDETPKEGAFSRKLSISSSGWVVWRSQIKSAGEVVATIWAGKRISEKTLIRSGIPSDANDTLSLALEIDGAERARLEGLSHLLTLSCQGISGSLAPAGVGVVALSGSLSQVEGFSLSSRLLCAIRDGDFDRVRFFLERIGKALWQEDKADFSRRLALSLLTGLRESLGLGGDGGNFYPEQLAETFSPSSLALWMDAVIKNWEVKGIADKLSPRHTQEAISYLQENFRRDISLVEVADKINLSTAYFSRLFKDQVGKGFVDYLAGLRITEAKRLLKGSHKSLAEIATLCGFGDQSYFTKTFKKYEGVNPGQFRRRLDARV